MKVLLNCCPKPYATPAFNAETAPKTVPAASKPEGLTKDTVEISKPKAKEENTTIAKEANEAKCEGPNCPK